MLKLIRLETCKRMFKKINSLKNSQYIYYLNYRHEEYDCWYIFQVDKLRKVLFERRFDRNERINLSDYGKILHSGWGKAPDIEMKREYEQKYGFQFSETE